jgi:hypothetical protein
MSAQAAETDPHNNLSEVELDSIESPIESLVSSTHEPTLIQHDERRRWAK